MSTNASDNSLTLAKPAPPPTTWSGDHYATRSIYELHVGAVIDNDDWLEFEEDHLPVLDESDLLFVDATAADAVPVLRGSCGRPGWGTGACGPWFGRLPSTHRAPPVLIRLVRRLTV
jgi:hypothetical protein